MNYDTSVLSDDVNLKGKSVYACRYNEENRYIGCFIAVLDGTKNPELSKLEWDPIMDVGDNSKYLGQFTSSVNNNFYDLWLEGFEDD